MLYFKESPEGVIFKVRVQPRSSKNMVVGLLDDALKIKLTAPPVEGWANSMCVKYLAKLFSVPASRLKIVSGRTGKTKYVLFKYDGDTPQGNPEELKSKIESLYPTK